MGFFFMGYAQQSSIDSLEQIYSASKFKNSEELVILERLSKELQDPQQILYYSNLLIKKATERDSAQYLYNAYVQKGTALRLKSDLTLALESLFKAAKIATDANSLIDLGTVNIGIADVYSVMGNHENSINYYKESIRLLREAKTDSISLASALLNAGDEFFNAEKYDLAISYFLESSLIFKKKNYLIGTAYNLGNMGMVYAKQGKDNLAKANINEALEILLLEKDFYPISVYLTYMSEIYQKQGNWQEALDYSLRSLELAKDYGLKDQISKANYQLSQLYETKGDLKQSFKYFKDYATYKDSVASVANVQEMANQRSDFEIAKKQIEVDLYKQQKENQTITIIAIGVALLLVIILSVGLFRRNKFINRTSKIIGEEKERSESLLLNILPEETALELKQSGKVKAKKFNSVTVLFTDFISFTSLAESLSPENLVKNVDYYFSKFDEIIEKHHLEKIKTIGDAYMCVGGVPFESPDHPTNAIAAAKEIIEFVNAAKTNKEGIVPFEIRIGIHTGPVVAGVVGTKKFAYDIWGDTVNIASRMESNSASGHINISESTYNLVRHTYTCAYRGEVKVKNKEALKMYFVES